MADGGDGTVLMGPWSGQKPEMKFVPAKDYIQPYADINYDVTPPPVEATIIKIEPKPTPSHMFLTRLQEISDRNVQTAIKKNSDYANPDRPFANFEQSPTVGVSVARGMLVRMQDKMSRISNLLDRPAAVADESILDSLDDLSNYALILRIWLEWNHGEVGI